MNFSVLVIATSTLFILVSSTEKKCRLSTEDFILDLDPRVGTTTWCGPRVGVIFDNTHVPRGTLRGKGAPRLEI